jgi:hypothetical protein
VDLEYLTSEDEAETIEIVGMAQDALNDIIEKIAFLDKDGTVDLSKLDLDYQIEGETEAEEEDEDEDEPNYPLQHYANTIGWELVKHIS